MGREGIKGAGGRRERRGERVKGEGGEKEWGSWDEVLWHRRPRCHPYAAVCRCRPVVVPVILVPRPTHPPAQTSWHPPAVLPVVSRVLWPLGNASRRVKHV
jgi:hypothetical protein